jgi:hypothetical protein
VYLANDGYDNDDDHGDSSITDDCVQMLCAFSFVTMVMLMVVTS